MEAKPPLPPALPEGTPEYVAICLQALATSRLGGKISLGGAIGLMHYFTFRATHDVDAWWLPSTTSEEQRQVVALLEETLRPFGRVQTRSWGDVTSVELESGGKTVFSFQIARRSAQLEPLRPSPWGGVWLDSFDDLVASKMVALVERGAPRDFLDIFRICQERLISVTRCWRLWQQRQELAGSDVDLKRARLAVQTHLARIERHRPLKAITDPVSRAETERLRAWFKTGFIDAAEEQQS